MDRERLEFIRRVTRKHQVDLRLLSQVPEALPSSLHVYAIGHNAVVTIPHARLTGSAAQVKKSMDIILGSFGLLIALVPMALIAVSIKDSRRQDQSSSGKRVSRREADHSE